MVLPGLTILRSQSLGAGGTSWSPGGYEPVGPKEHLAVNGGYPTAYVGGTGKTGCDRWFILVYGNRMNPSNNIYVTITMMLLLTVMFPGQPPVVDTLEYSMLALSLVF